MTTIVVQRGHVGRITGATGAPGEQRFTTEAAQRCAVHLRALGYRVNIIDADVPDAAYRGDAFVAVHYDSSNDPGAHGASVGYQGPPGRVAALAWKRHYAANGWTRGFRGDNYTSALGGYYGVRRAIGQGNERAFILEAGFHSNPGDAALLASPGGPDRVGRTVAATMVDVFGCNCPPDTTPPAPAPPIGERLARVPATCDVGDAGSPVRKAQGLLLAHGYPAGPLVGENGLPDGIFGPGTQRTVESFQASHRLLMDGIVGPATWQALIEQ